MASWLKWLNKLLPFATPGTPLLQDVIHLAIICLALYFAPQIQDYFRQSRYDEFNTAPEQHVQEEDYREPVHQAADNVDSIPQPAQADDHAIDNENDRLPNIDVVANQAVADPDDPLPDAAEAAGPATPGTAQRNVGAKKAKSLARRDQRRAYHEFMRTQGDAQRAQDAKGAAEREAAQAAERARRQVAQATLEAKKAREREVKRETERKARELQQRRRDEAVRLVRGGLEQGRRCELLAVAEALNGSEWKGAAEVVDEIWIEKLIAASGMLGRSKEDGAMTFVTSTGWVVRVGEAEVVRMYELAEQAAENDADGKVGVHEMAGMLEQALKGG